MSIIVGTAGHVDHGKTSLIKAINGFEGDTLAEEKRRGITIDLSFSSLKNGDDEISFIDVPGHENLVKTMISGAFGFDVALLVIAADDGIMPQSMEHMRVLSLLGVNDIILAITKTDLASKEQALKVQSEVKAEINRLNLKLINSFFLSIKQPQSIDGLRQFLLSLKPKRRETSGIFRYYIDRSFSLKGIGQVVTGTVIEGSVSNQEKIFVCDLGKEANVREVQTHDKPTQKAYAGQRAALNLSGVTQLERGMLLSKKGVLRGFCEADCLFLGDIAHNADVLFCVGSKQIGAKAIIISERDKTKFVTFKFKAPLFLKFNESFIVLENSRLIGGGKVLNPITEPLKKPAKIRLLSALSSGDFSSAFELLKSAHKNGFGLISSFQRFGLSHDEAIKIAQNLKDAIVDKEALNIYPQDALNRVKDFISFIIDKNPHALLSATSISLKLGWASTLLAQIAIDELVLSGILACENGVYFKFGADFSQIKIKLEDEIYSIINRAGLTPEAPYNIYDMLEIDRTSGDNALKKLTKNGRVIRLAHNLFIAKSELEKALKELKNMAKNKNGVGVQEVKEALNLSRKYAIAYLERLDLEPDIIKIGDKRKTKENQ